MESGTPRIKCQWNSKRGSARKENRDACGVFASDAATFAIVMDASEKGERGVEFNAKWIDLLLQAMGGYLTGPSVEQVQGEMREAHKRLRPPSFLLETASYCALLIRHDIGKAWAFNCGDCRIGVEYSHGVVWFSPVHSLANIQGGPFTVEHANNPDRHTVTRCLKVRRFTTPEVIEIEYSPSFTWILASDGYWIEALKGGALDVVSEDDQSWLRLNNRLVPLCESDAKNLLVAGLHVKPGYSDCESELVSLAN